MKVLHIISDANIGGAGVLLCNLLRHFDPAKIRSTVALPQGSALIPRVRACGVPVIPLRNPCDRASVSSLHELCRMLAVGGYDLVHTNAALSGRIAARLCRVPVVYTRHCCFVPPDVFRIPLVRWGYGVSDRVLSDRAIATADAALENLCALGVRRDRISVVINGSEPVRGVEAEELAAVRARYGLEASDFTVGICARLEPCKGHDTFLAAAAECIKRQPAVPFRFLIVGEGGRRAALEEQVRLRGLSPFVRFTGFVSDMAPIYRLLRVNVNCSVGTETSCLSLSEGMSAGVPMVATRYGGNPAMVGDDGAGILVEIRDASALADAICCIATDPALETQMRSAAYERYCRSYTAERMARETMEVYRDILSHQMPRRAEATAK